MRRRETWPVVALSAVLALATGCSAQLQPVPTTPAPPQGQAQKEVNAMKPEKKQQSKPKTGSSGGPPGGLARGMPDLGSNRTVSPQATQAIALAQSNAETDHEQLARMLLDRAWLDRLDPPRTAVGIDPRFLQLTRVLEAAARHAPQALEAPAGDALYLESDYRRASLIEASGAAASPGPKLIELWRSQLDPDADELGSAVEALVSSRSQAALGLLEDAFASTAFDTELVISWFRGPILRHRQDPQLLAALERMMEGPRLHAKRRFALVEALFEYRPNDWYIGTGPPPAPPLRADLTEAARARLRSIADRAVREKLIDCTQRARIESELAPVAPPGSDSHGRR